jgi:hypothetical protein
MNFRIKKIVTSGPPITERLYREHYGRTRLEFLDRWGVELPRLAYLENHRYDVEEIRIFRRPLCVEIWLEDGRYFRYIFKQGFWTDFASVPKFFRGSVDNDGHEILFPAFVHDANFAGQFMSFNHSNRLFYRMIRYFGGSWWMAVKAAMAVASPVGRIFYRRHKKNKKAVAYYRRFAALVTNEKEEDPYA